LEYLPPYCPKCQPSIVVVKMFAIEKTTT
jgi:hypothetical protein